MMNEIVFKDEHLKRVICENLSLKSDIITRSDLEMLTDLDASNCQISDIEPLQYAVNLKSLDLDWNEVADISPLSHLGKLQMLSAKNQQFFIGTRNLISGEMRVEDEIIDAAGHQLLPTEVFVGHELGNTVYDARAYIKGGAFVMQEDLLQEGMNAVGICYRDEAQNFDVMTIFVVNRA